MQQVLHTAVMVQASKDKARGRDYGVIMRIAVEGSGGSVRLQQLRMGCFKRWPGKTTSLMEREIRPMHMGEGMEENETTGALRINSRMGFFQSDFYITSA